MSRPKLAEADLYEPVKALLEQQGYEVKAEVGAADVVAIREKQIVIIELKTGFSLSLFHQAIERQSMTDVVYIAVFHKTGRIFQKQFRRNKALCRRLGIGLITVSGLAALVHVDPGPYKPRKSKAKTGRLLKEFQDRVGDPNTGGQTRKGLMTTYRQNALKCLTALHDNGPLKAAKVKDITGAGNARNIMADNHYGWFERASRGIYTLSPKGLGALETYKSELDRLS